MKSKNKKIGLVVLAAILASSVVSVIPTPVGAQPVEVWNVTWGGKDIDRGLAVATAGDCVYLAGETSPSKFHTDAFLNKYNSTDGTLIWNLTWRGTGNNEGNAIATAGASVYLAGYTDDGRDAFLNKYSSTDGTLIWNTTWNGGGYATATAGDSVYLAGENFSFGAGYVAFLNKYDKDGTLIWNLTWGETGSSEVGWATAATGDSVYLAGTINNTGGFLNKYNSTDGTLIWNITTENASGYTTATAGDSVYLAGETWSFGVADDAFLNKYSSDGSLIWNITWGGTGVDAGSAVATTGDSVYLAGGAGGSDLLGMSNFTAFLNKYNSTDGTLIWNLTWGWGRPFNDTVATATATTGDSVYLAGYIGGPDIDAFLVKFSEPTPTENVTGECKTLWYFDDQSVKCQQKEFCGLYMYQGLRTFETEEECKAAFEKYLREKKEETPTPSPTPTPTPLPTPTPAPPGFEAGFAIAGLLTVAYLVLRRRRN